MSDSVKHCPNPSCPHRAQHGRPAEFKTSVETCPDCGAELKEGTGCFDCQELDSAETLDVLCGQALSEASKLGEAKGPGLVLGKPPGLSSGPLIQLGTGLVMMGLSLWLVNQQRYWAITGFIAGFIIFFLGVSHFKQRDVHQRRVRPFRGGFVYEIDKRGVSVAYSDLEKAELKERTQSVRGVPVGLFHDLILSCRQKVYTLTSFESVAGNAPRETPPFVSWAKQVVELVSKRR